MMKAYKCDMCEEYRAGEPPITIVVVNTVIGRPNAITHICRGCWKKINAIIEACAK